MSPLCWSPDHPFRRLVLGTRLGRVVLQQRADQRPGHVELVLAGAVRGISDDLAGSLDVDRVGCHDDPGGLVQDGQLFEDLGGAAGLRPGGEREVGVVDRTGGPGAEDGRQLRLLPGEPVRGRGVEFTPPTTCPSTWMGMDRVLSTP